MVYVPKLINPDEVRIFLQPFLSYDDMEDFTILAKIEAVETYLSEVWYGGTYPSKGKIPALLLVASKIMKEPGIQGEHYREVNKIGDISFGQSVRSAGAIDKMDPYSIAITWEEMAYAILRSENHGNIYKIKKIWTA